VVFRTLKRIVIFVIGVTVLLFGIVMIVAPGPAIVVIPLGLAVLATEFVWAKRLLKRFNAAANAAVSSLRRGSKNRKIRDSHLL